MTAVAEATAENKVRANKPYKFQIMGGAHLEGSDIKVYKRTAEGLEELVGEFECDADFRLAYPQGIPYGYRKLSKDVMYGPGRPVGDIISSDLELDKMYDRNGSKKYRRLDENNNPVVEELKAERIGRQEAENRYRKALARMSPRELIDLAAEDGVDLKGETKKEGVQALLLASAGI